MIMNFTENGHNILDPFDRDAVVGEDATTPGQVQDVETSPPLATPDKRLCIHVEQPSI